MLETANHHLWQDRPFPFPFRNLPDIQSEYYLSDNWTDSPSPFYIEKYWSKRAPVLISHPSVDKIKLKLSSWLEDPTHLTIVFFLVDNKMFGQNWLDVGQELTLFHGFIQGSWSDKQMPAWSWSIIRWWQRQRQRQRNCGAHWAEWKLKKWLQIYHSTSCFSTVILEGKDIDIDNDKTANTDPPKTIQRGLLYNQM